MPRTLLLFSSLFLLVPAQAQVLDASFATNGELLGNTPNNVDEVVDMALQDDGRILTAGRSGPNGASLITATRYLSDGQLDVGFGTGGNATLTISGNDYPQALALQPDGKVLVAGFTDYTNDSTDLFAVRFTADGQPDASFGSNGVVDLDLYPKGMQGSDMLVLPDGGILLAANVQPDSGPSTGLLVKLLPDGTLDPAFQGGALPLPNPLGGTCSVEAITLDGQGRIVAAGRGANPVQYTNFQWMAWRLLPDGALDTSFASSGVYVFDFTDVVDGFSAVTVQPDGRILLGGNVGQSGFNSSLIVLRLMEDGTEDVDWLNNGLVYYDGYTPAQPHTLNVEADGHVLISGEVRLQAGGQIAGFLARTDATGALDPDFGTDGILLVGPDLSNTRFYKGLLQPDGRWLLGGQRMVGSNIDVLLQRYYPDLPMAVAPVASSVASVSFREGAFHVTGAPARSLDWTVNDITGRKIPVRAIRGAQEVVLEPLCFPTAGSYVISGSGAAGTVGAVVVLAQ